MKRGLARALAGSALIVGAGISSGCGAHVGYPLTPEFVRNGRTQHFRLAVANLEDARPEEEQSYRELERLVGPDDAKGRTTDDGFSGHVRVAVSDTVARHLAFAGCFSEVGRVDLPSDEQIDLLKSDIHKLARDFDAVLIG